MAISRETYGRDPSRLVSKNNPPSWERGGGGWKEVRNANTRRYTRLAMETNESISPCRGANKPGQLLSRTPSLFLPLQPSTTTTRFDPPPPLDSPFRLFKVSSDKRSRYRVGVVVGVDIICQEITQLASQLCGPTDLTN